MHIVAIGPREYGVYPTHKAPRGKYGEYEVEPVFKGTLEECQEHVDDRYEAELYVQTAIVPPWYIADAEKRADKYRERIDETGAKVSSDVIYKESAAWKEHPTHYAYTGDFGGCAKLSFGDKVGDAEKQTAYAYLQCLFGFASALWELGLVLTFDKDGKHTIYGNHPQWVTLEQED